MPYIDGLKQKAEGVPTYGDITINGGIINAVSGYCAAGIGGGHTAKNTETGTITINGGKITATGNNGGAGIGGGSDTGISTTFVGKIVINGGNIKANAANRNNLKGANISGGNNGYADITINGGVTDAGNTSACHGIGSGAGNTSSTIKLKWTNASDRIYSLDYAGTITLDDSTPFIPENTNTLATTKNIASKTIVPARKITLRATTNGTVSLPNNAKSGSYFGAGSTVELTVIPDVGYGASSVNWSGTEIEPVNGVYSFEMPTTDVTVTAEFASDSSHFAVNEDGSE